MIGHDYITMDFISIMIFHIVEPFVNQIKIFFTDKNIFPPVYRIRYKINSFRCKIPDSCSHKILLLIQPRKLIFTICYFNWLSYPSESRKSAGDSDGGLSILDFRFLIFDCVFMIKFRLRDRSELFFVLRFLIYDF